MLVALCDEALPQSIHLLHRVVERAARVDDHIGHGEAFVIACLRRNALLGGCSIKAAQSNQSLNPHVGGSMHDDHERELTRRARLDEQRNVVDDDCARVTGANGSETLSIQPMHFGVNDGIEVGPRVGVTEHNAAECGAIEASVSGEHRIPKPLVNGTEARRTRSHRLARERIGIDDGRSELRKSRRDHRLSRRDSACEPDDIHAVTLSR